MTDTRTLNDLLNEGRAAALVGDNFVARTAFRRATELDPQNASAWAELAGVTPMLALKRTKLQQALALDPDMTAAALALREVERMLGEGLTLAPALRRSTVVVAEEIRPETEADLVVDPPPPLPDVMFCYRHPDRETVLRCNACERPICTRCATLTPVGQICPECRDARRPTNYKVAPPQIIYAALIGLALGGVMTFAAVYVMTFVGLFIGIILAFFLGQLSGEAIVRLTDRVTRSKRGRPMQLALGISFGLAGVPLALLFEPLALAFVGFVIHRMVTQLR